MRINMDIQDYRLLCKVLSNPARILNSKKQNPVYPVYPCLNPQINRLQNPVKIIYNHWQSRGLLWLRGKTGYAQDRRRQPAERGAAVP